MICRDCDKKLKGGFSQEDGTFLCAKCIMVQTREESAKFVVAKAIELLEAELPKYRRPTKTQIREAIGWLRVLR